MDEALSDTPAARADRLLRDVMGESRYRQFRAAGFLDLASGRCAGRVYRLDSSGNLSYREPGEAGFNTTLCVQPLESIPLDDQVAMRYLLVTADEESLAKIANPITFGFLSLTRALYHDFRQRYPSFLAAALTLAIVGFFLGSVWLEAWTLTRLLQAHPVGAIILFLVLVVPGFIGLVLLLAAGTEGVRSVRVALARRRLAPAAYPG